MPFRAIVAFNCKNPMAPTNTLCEKDADFVNFKASGTYNYRCALNSSYHGLPLCLVLHSNVMIGEHLRIYLTKLIRFSDV